MPKFSQRSLERLAQADERLQIVFREVIKRFDCRVTCGFRNEEEQNKCYDEGTSTKKWPNSKHNTQPSLAVDVVPYPVDWDNIDRFKCFGYYVLGCAAALDIPLRWGADWNMNMIVTDETFFDWPHYEIAKG